MTSVMRRWRQPGGKRADRQTDSSCRGGGSSYSMHIVGSGVYRGSGNRKKICQSHIQIPVCSFWPKTNVWSPAFYPICSIALTHSVGQAMGDIQDFNWGLSPLPSHIPPSTAWVHCQSTARPEQFVETHSVMRCSWWQPVIERGTALDNFFFAKDISTARLICRLIIGVSRFESNQIYLPKRTQDVAEKQEDWRVQKGRKKS